MKIKIVIVFIVTAIVSSCQFNQSVNKDLLTGAYSRGNGIGVDDIIMEINGDVDNRNEFIFGEKVNLIFNKVSGLTRLDGKTYPELAIHIVKNQKDTILSNPNLLKGLDHGTNLSPLQLQANFVAAFPSKIDDSFKAHIEIKDKKGDGTFKYELPFTLKENDLLTINSNGIDYANIYLWNKTLKQPVFNSTINSEHLFYLILNNVEGLEVINEKVFPVFSLELSDSKGNKVISNTNLLSAYEEVGADLEDLKKQVSASITFSKGQINNPYTLTAKLKDKYSEKEVSITAELIIN